ncbi:MAG TPA: hypothetical protein VF384_06500 [Planctomycetota bacterium]
MRHLVLASLTFLTTLASQAAPPRQASPREQFTALLLDAGPWPERVEVRGKILVVADFVAAAREQNVAAEDLARTVADNLLLAVLTEELQHQKTWLSDADYEAAYAAYAKPYDETPFKVKVIATRFNAYPDLPSFQRRWRVMQSFVRAQKLEQPPLAELELEAKLSLDFLTGALVQAEVWVHEAQLAADGRRDFAAAEGAARQSLQQLAAGKEPEEREGVQCLRPDNGRPIPRNQLRTALGEGEYHSLHHDLAADAVFAAEPGKLLGPVRTKTGVLVARVLRRPAGEGRVDVDDPRKQDLLRQMVEQRRFLAWVDQVLVSTGIRIDGRPFASPAPANAGKAK